MRAKILLLLLLITTVILIMQIIKTSRIADVLDASYIITNEMTHNLKDYIVQGEKQYIDRYWKAFNTRKGGLSWGTYLDDPFFLNNKMSMYELYVWAGMSNEAKDYLDKSYEVTNDIFWFEIEAINWNNGKYDNEGKAREEYDAMGLNKVFIEFPDTGSPDPKKAIDILYTDEYLDKQDEALSLVKKCSEIILKRRRNLEYSISFILSLLYIILFYFSGK